MQIKQVKPRKTEQKELSVLDKTIVYELHVKDLFKESGRIYVSHLRGTFAYIFDSPEKVSNSVLIDWGTKDTKTVLSIAEFVHHLIFWRANIAFQYPIEKSKDLYTALADPQKDTLNDICNAIVERMLDKEGRITERICNTISLIKEDLSYLAEGWAPIECNTINDYDIIEFKNRDPEFAKLLFTELDETKTIKELEQEMKDLERRLMTVIERDNRNCFAPYVRSGRIKIAQLTKILCAVGTRSDIDKSIFPVPIKRGYIHGLANTGECYIDAVTARDAILIKSQNVPISGTLSRQTNRLTSNITIDYKNEDCGSKNYLEFEIKNEDYLKTVEGKWYLDEKSNTLKEIKMSDTQFIGKTIKFRSIIGCCGKNGICQKCVGTIARRLRKTRAGSLVAVKMINPLSNGAMSAKHNTATKSAKLTSDTIKKYFYNEGTNFFIKREYASKRDLYIVVLQEEIEEIISSNAFDDNDFKPKLSFIGLRDGTEEFVIENDGMEISLSDEILQNKSIFYEEEDTEYVLIPVIKTNDSEPIFSVMLYTEEISKYLNVFINAIDRASVSTRYKTYHELIENIVNVVYNSGFTNKMIHYENIVYHMIRDINDVTRRPDMSIENPQYQILNVSNAIEKGNMYDALSYQGLRRLFKSIDIRERYGTSVYDSFFRVTDMW